MATTSRAPNGRKRPFPGSLLDDSVAPPNKSLPKTTEKEGRLQQEREYLHQKVAEASKNPFFLPPRQMPVYPVHAFSPKPSFPSPIHAMRMYPLLSHSARAMDASSPGRQQSSSGAKSSSPNPFASPIYLRYPLPPTPQLLNSSPGLGFLQPWSPAQGAAISTPPSISSPPESGRSSTTSLTTTGLASNSTHVVTTTTTAPTQGLTQSTVCHSTSISSTNTATSSAMPQYIFSPHNIHVRSPYSLYNPSPSSPMVMLPSPYGSSCPSVSSSSGCSSMSEGSGVVRNFSYQDHPFSRNTVHIAPTEYHVGIRPSYINVVDDDDDGEGEEEEEDEGESQTKEAGAAADVGEQRMQAGANTTRPASSGEWRVASTGEGSPLKSVSVNTPSPADSDYPLSVQSLLCSDNASSSTRNRSSHIHSVDRPSSGISSISSYISSRDCTPELEDSRPMVIDSNFIQRPVITTEMTEVHNTTKEEQEDSESSDIFCMVPGRLSLLSATQKYRVTVDEVQRRLSSPECLNASVLGGILRRAKSKNGGHLLRQRLEGIGVSLPPGRRKATELSLLTSLVEGESLHLSSDFNRLCNNFFPHTELAQIIGRQHVDTPQVQDRVSMVKAAQILLTEFQGMVDAVGGPSNIRPTDPHNPYPGLTNFSLITHGFGNPAISTVISQIQQYLSELLAIYEGRTSVEQDMSAQAANCVPSESSPCVLSGRRDSRNYALGDLTSSAGLHSSLKKESRDGAGL